MLKYMGLNTVETYVPWFLHEPTRGNFTSAGELDIVGFLEVARALEINVILRPGVSKVGGRV
jgi:beta-galactosidase